MGFSTVQDLLRNVQGSLKQTDLYGYVVDNNDPLKRQRVKIRIPQLHRGVPDSLLPWSLPAGAGHENSGGGMGSVHIPAKGAKMRIKFDSNDPHRPRYDQTGSPKTGDVNDANELRNHPDYPYVRGHVDPAGNKWEVNTKEGKESTTLTTKQGTVVSVDKDGVVQIHSPKGINITTPENITLSAGKKINIHAGGELNMKGTNIVKNGAGDRASVTSTSPRQRPTPPTMTGKTSM